MNVVEKEAKAFSETYFENRYLNTLSNLKSALDTKLYVFSRDRDKLDFLRILRNESVLLRNKHKIECRSPNCNKIEEYETGIFAIDQEIDSINKYYIFEIETDDKFSTVEESEIQVKLNEIIESLKNLGLGQEIIYEEIESLKNHFNLGKKTWIQLLKGKLFDITTEGIISNIIVSPILDTLGNQYKCLIN